MNLLQASWLPFRTRDGGVVYRSPSALADPDVVDLAMPRSDFQGAAYQWLIGLLHTVTPPDDHDDWLDRLVEPPTEAELDKCFAPLHDAFALCGDGPRFMQDLDPLDDVTPGPVAGLLIDSPGANGIKLNTDHFVKRDRVEAICPVCAAMALFTMQINAPSGGVGYRVGLRGGGPLTTLIMPDDAEASLWQRLWLNVAPLDEITPAGLVRTPPKAEDATLFPWMGPTRLSDTKGAKVLPEDMHPLHAFWAMPRRFRLLFEEKVGHCDLCGREATNLVSQIRAKNYGANYEGPWLHPLAPYRRDPKKPGEAPLSLKGQPGGLGYRHWAPLVLADPEHTGAMPAAIIHDYLYKKVPTNQQARREGEPFDPLLRHGRLWVFGFDMDNMKPRGWYATEMPLVAVPAEQQEVLRDWVQSFVVLGTEVAKKVRNQIKAAWFKRPSDAKGDMSSVDGQFYDATQTAFFHSLMDMQQSLLHGERSHVPTDTAQAWYRSLRREAMTLFDSLALSGPSAEINMRRVTGARRELEKWLRAGTKGSKPVADFAKQGGFELTKAKAATSNKEASS